MYKKVWSYWWDFCKDDGNDLLIIGSDNPRRPLVKRWKVGEDVSREFEEAMSMISDLECGRLSLKNIKEKNDG